jgi:hypothetical protein
MDIDTKAARDAAGRTTAGNFVQTTRKLNSSTVGRQAGEVTI